MKLQKFSLFAAVAGTLMLTTALVPKANAVVLRPIEYFNFEAAGTAVYDNGPLLSTNPFNGYTFLQGGNAITNVNFPSGGATGGLFQVVTGGVGTGDGALSPDVSTDAALALNGNTSGPGSSLMYCFKFSVDTTTYAQLSLSFELNSIGSGGQFTGVEVFYSLNGSTFIASTEGLTPITQGGGYHPYTATLDLAGKTTNTTMIEFCFSGSTNSDTKNRTFVDNIVVNAVIPEPSTYIGGLLGVVVLCWYQREWLMRALRFRCA